MKGAVMGRAEAGKIAEDDAGERGRKQGAQRGRQLSHSQSEGLRPQLGKRLGSREQSKAGRRGGCTEQGQGRRDTFHLPPRGR